MPGYTSDLYNYIVGLDPTFKNDVSLDQFKSKMSDTGYSKNMYDWVGQNDKTFHSDVSFDAFREKLGYKKKGPTVLPSVQKQAPTSLGTQPKGNQKPLGTSVSQKESKPEILFPAQKGKRNDVFTTEDGKTYRLDMSTGRPVWKGYTSSVVKGQGGSKQDYEIYNTIISNPNTVNALNKTFGKQASTSDTDQIYTGLVGKEENQYRVYNDNWQRLTPNSNNWEQVNSEGAISYLNKNYGKNVKVPTTVKKEDKEYQFTDINSQLISKTEEKVVPYLQRQYGKLGFNFEESGLGTDYVKVTSKNGNTIEVSLDENNPEEALKLKSFLQGNKSEIQTDASKKVNDLIREVNRFDLGSEYKKQATKELNDYRQSQEFVDDLKQMNFNEIESNINSIKNRFIITNNKEGLQDFYNSPAYKLYKEKEKENSSAKAEKIDSLYYELKQAKTPEEKKQAKIKIDTYLSDKVINKQSDNYNIQLGDVSESYKKLNAAISQFDKDKADLDQRVNSGNIGQEEYESLAESINKRAEYLDSRRQEIKSEKDKLISDMNKLQSITGQYLIDKEKTGSFAGNMLNSFISGTSKIFEPSMQVLASAVSDKIMMKLDPDELKMLKSKGYNDEEIKNYTVNKETKKLKEEFRSGLVEAFGTSETTKEYAQSKDRGFFEKALSGVAESLPGMLAPGGAIVKVGALGAQAYSSIEDEMLADKDFETTSALDRSVVALPYAIGMGILENLGISSAMSKNPLAKSLLTKSLLSAVKKVGGDASKEVIENVISKEIKSNIAKYGIRIVGGALAEAETGALQSAVLDIGLKKLYNSWKDANDGKTAETLTEGEYFSTPDTFMGGLSQVAEDAAAEAIGGWAMTTVGTSAQAIMNKGQISLYNDKDVEFLKGLSTDPEVKKMFIAKLKTNMLQGSMTKSEAQEQLNSLNELESTFSKIPDNITGENLKKSVGLISERNKLTQEIEGKDESLTAVQKARITNINNELKTISENAVKESNIEEVTAEGGGIQRERVDEGQLEVGQREGAVGQAAQQEADLGNRPVEGRRTEEEVKQYELEGKTYEVTKEVIKDADTGESIDTFNVRDAKTGEASNISFIDIINKGKLIGETTVKAEIAKALDGVKFNADFNLPLEQSQNSTQVAEAYIKAKQDGSNSELVKAVENIIGKPAVVAEEVVAEQPITETEQKIVSNLEQKIKQYETEQESKGIGAEETITTDQGRQVKTIKLERPKESNARTALSIDTGNSPRAAVLKYFVGGGKINSTALQKLFGDKQGKSIKGETQSRIGLIDNKKGKTPVQIAEYLWAEYGEQFNMNDQDFLPYVEEVISEFKGTKNMISELLSVENKSEEDYYKQMYGDNFEGYDNSEIEQAESVLDYMTDEEIIQMANDIESAEKQFAEQPAAEETIESLKALDVTDKTNLQKIQSFLDKLDNDLDKFGKETLGVNLPVAVAKAVIKTLKSLVNAGVSLEQALKQAAEIHNVSEVDIVDSFEKVRKKETEASKAAKKISKPTQKKVIVNEAVALREQLRLEARAARESAMDLKRKQRALVAVVNGMKRNGSINVNQATALAKRIVNTNIDNPVMVKRMLDYAERLFERADYQEVLKNAFGLRNKIRKAAKSKGKLQAEVAGMAKKFSKIDPSLVEDVDLYMEIAEKVYGAVRPVRLIKTGLVTKIAADIAQISEYQAEEIKRQDEILKNEAMDMHKYLVDSGAISSEMSLKEIRDVITILENNPEADVTDRESIIRDYVKKAFDVYSGIIIDMVKTGIDPMTGEEVSFDEKQKDIIKRLIGIDTDFMKLEDAYKSIEALDNFIVNKITSGVETIVNSYEGKLNAEAMERSGIKTRPIKLFFSGLGGRFMAEYFASLPVLIDTMFGGINAGQKFMNLSGLNEFANGVAAATREQNNIINEYGQKFEKSKPNGMDFRSAENVYERGMLAYLSRTIDGTSEQQRQELGRRINIVKDSIEALSNGDKDQKKISEIYQSLYDKLSLDEFNASNDNLTLSDIQSRADKTNLEATNWWIEKWAEKYSDLSDVSLSVYNTELGSDINYTPDRYSKVEGKEDPINDINLQKAGAFGMDLNFTDKNKTGVLMETTRPKKTPGRYVNLDFDISNARSMKAALVDINTAASVRKIDGFLRSPSMNKIIEDNKDKQILQRRINNYIRRSKHKAVINDATFRELDSAFNYVASIGAVKALGGIFQPIKQTMPVMINTIINAGPQNMSLASVMGDSDMHEWINNSGMAIANRGMEASTTVETANKYLDKVAGSKGEALGKGLMKINEFWLKKFLQQPDVWIARSSFISYYKQSLRRKGVDVSKIDWKNHPVDKEAANYAQHMVDRQQNVSDAAMMGEIMASESGAFKIGRKTLLPFANFIMNQKSRMYSDFRTASSSEATKEDKIAALRSLGGLTIELASYQYIGYLIGGLIKSLAANLVGYEPDDEEEEKNKKYAIQNASNQYIKDVLSPLPLTDGVTLKAFDFISDQLQNLMISDDEIKDAINEENKARKEIGEEPMTDKQKEKLKEDLINSRKYKFEDYKNDKLFNLGTLSIAFDKSAELWEMTKMAKTGQFTEESYGTEKTKYINKADQKKMAYLTALKFASLSGALPVEANNLAMYSTKYIKKRAMTENQKDMSTELMKEMNIKELKDYQVALIEKKKSVDSLIEEVNWVESNGGLKNKKQQEEYIRVLNKNGEVTSDDLYRIQRLK